MPSSASGVFSTDGEQRNRGLELNVFGQVTEEVRVLGGVSLIDARLTQTSDGSFDGNDAPGVPGVQLTFGTEWDTLFVPGLTLSGRVIYTGKQPLDNANTRDLSAWTRFDLGALQLRGRRYADHHPGQRRKPLRQGLLGVLGVLFQLGGARRAAQLPGVDDLRLLRQSVPARTAIRRSARAWRSGWAAARRCAPGSDRPPR